MRPSRFFALGLVSLLAPSPAAAELSLATREGDAATSVEHAELALASANDERAVLWVSLRVANGPVAVVVALAEGTEVESGLDAWLASLEETASPRVFPPPGRVDCGVPASPRPVSRARARGRAPDAELRLDAEDVSAALQSHGLALPTPLTRAGEHAVWVWEGESAEPYTTRTLRLRGAASTGELKTSQSFPVVLSALTRGAMRYRDERDKEVLPLTFLARGLSSRSSSDYLPVSRSWLEAGKGPLVEQRGRGLLFDWSIYEDRLTLAPLFESYVSRAAAEADVPDAAACGEQLSLLRDAPNAETTACGSADDFALALQAVPAESATLVRVIASSRSLDPRLFEPGGDPVSPVVEADALDASLCPGTEQAPPVTPPAVPRGSEPPQDADPVVVYDPYVVEREPVEDDYYAADSGCGSDTSSGQDDGVDCSSDTSSSQGDEPGCSSDTREPSGSDDAGCSSDTSSSSSSDESCDGGPSTEDEDSGYDGDTCSGSAAPRGESRAAVTATGPSVRRVARPARLRASLWSIAFAAVVLPIRRRKRASRRGG